MLICPADGNSHVLRAATQTGHLINGHPIAGGTKFSEKSVAILGAKNRRLEPRRSTKVGGLNRRHHRRMDVGAGKLFGRSGAGALYTALKNYSSADALDAAYQEEAQFRNSRKCAQPEDGNPAKLYLLRRRAEGRVQHFLMPPLPPCGCGLPTY